MEEVFGQISIFWYALWSSTSQTLICFFLNREIVTLEPESWEGRNEVVENGSNEEHDGWKNDNKDDVEEKYALGVDGGEEIFNGSGEILFDGVDWEYIGPGRKYNGHVVYDLEVKAVHEQTLGAVDGPASVRE